MQRTSEPKQGEDRVEEVQTKPVPAELASEPKTTKNGIVLVPQPTDDPEDPLVKIPSHMLVSIMS
jgi:hypothetical protein